ncbi:MAG: N-acetylmuramoyl-L-alanine amidase [Clostridia bacterium]|nr:N-acetylmuramoyl-L-alanine amidase [Clostridia bacterium]
MKKIVKRRKTFRINNPLAFGILCAMILVLIGGGIYALAAGLAVPAVRNYQAANATPAPTPEAVPTPTPGVSTPTPTPTLAPGETPSPEPSPEGGLLAGRVIGIDPARGYSSRVRGSYTGIYANRLNYAVATLVRARLEALGAEVIVPLADVRDDMESSQRATILNSNNVELALRVECNFVDTADTRGALMWTNANHGDIEECDRLASAILTAYLAATEFPVQEYNGESIRHKDDETFLSAVEAPVCTLIMGYISNETDDRALNDEAFQATLADGIVEGILRYMGVEA